MANAIVQYGAQGTNAKILQQMLKRHGYNVDVDGIFGDNTLAAVNDFQKKYGLTVDGIVGQDTWQALQGDSWTPTSTTPATNPNTKGANTSKPTTTTTPSTTTKPTTNTNASSASASQPFNYKDFTYGDFNYKDFTYDDYKESDIVKDAYAALQAQLAQKPGEYKSQWQAQLDDTMNKILNREKFSYDLNGDALYQQYKDKYIQQGKMAMGDAIGQASAMTGGYGNSYAQSVGQQMYQKELQNLNDVVPELYQMALDKYSREGQDLYNQFAMLGDRENMDYGRYRDSVADFMTERDYLTGRYDSERGFDYSKYTDGRDFAYGKYADDKSYAYNEHRNAIEDALAREQFDYQKDRDKTSDEQWQAQFDAVYGNKDTTTTTTEPLKNLDNRGKYNNGNLTIDQVKALQKALGVEVDGLYGAGSKEAAGGLSAEEAYNKFIGNPQPQKGYSTIAGELDTFIAGGATKSKISAYIRAALAAGEITQSQAQKLLATYAPRGYTYR